MDKKKIDVLKEYLEKMINNAGCNAEIKQKREATREYYKGTKRGLEYALDKLNYLIKLQEEEDKGVIK